MHRPNRKSSVLNIWRFLDGRPGHENQVLGLTEAIARINAVDVVDVRVDENLRGLRSLLPGNLSFADSLPSPDLLIGAGHSTHLPLLACKNKFGGQTVVIMKPSLPVWMFDLCLIPAHDNLLFPTRNVLRTEGALNRIRPSVQQNPEQGLILIGGPSKHFRWSDSAVSYQLQSVIRQSHLKWTIATSERTPETFIRHWQTNSPHIPVVMSQTCGPDWLPEQLSQSGVVWVTCDSMSMIYEALTAGSRVGLLELAASSPGRISANIRRLTEMSLATPWSQWMEGRELPAFITPFSESDRCSVAVMAHFLSNSAPHSQSRTLLDFLTGRSPIENSNAQLDGIGGFAPGVRMSVRQMR